MAAEQNHWEAAGQLGNFYLYGIGIVAKPDLPQAHRFFQLGVPHGLQDCQRRYTQLSSKNKKKEKVQQIALCESFCLNGLAILHLVGIPDAVPVDWELAQAYLELAKEQGNAEALYNLAMLRLGWHRHWKLPEDVEDNGQTTLAAESLLFGKKEVPPLNHPSQAEYTSALSDFRFAAAKGHLQANFRAGLLYSEGVRIPSPKGAGTTHVISKDCERATKYFKWVVEKASPDSARRMRTAYQQYLAGDTENALRNYLTAASTGSETAQLNAAFLLEKGTCPGLANTVDCAKAAVRLYKAAAEHGQVGEACLRVGDFYYYGKLRSIRSPVGPLGWMRYLVFPEELWPFLAPWWDTWTRWLWGLKTEDSGTIAGVEESVCDTDDPNKPATCAAHTSFHEETSVHDVEGDLSMAAHYYQLATTSRDNARANFNLGFLYEWGLGMKQDFPLAKRHYDLAKASHNRDSDLPVVIALFTMSLHEQAIKFWAKFQQWRESGREPSVTGGTADTTMESERIPSPAISQQDGSPQPLRRSKTDVIMAHIFSWDSLLILILTFLFVCLLDYMRTR